ncbi:MAG: hypothetical protein RLZZ28_184 [Bacteroidota bacterium]|jgi:hypothetical protein
MAKNKTTETNKSVAAFIKQVQDPGRKADSHQIIELMTAATGFEPKLWGPSIVGFGSCHYVYESGREGDMPLVAFSPRSAAIVLYLSGSFENREELLARFGKHTTGKGCVYIKRLSDVDLTVLKKMILLSLKHTRKLYPDKQHK